MLSLQQAIEIRESIKSYLQATFTFRKREIADAYERFMDDPKHGMFKGPYVSLKLRFVKASQEEIEKIPLTIKPEWPPYDHQVKSWTRLSTNNKTPEPTIITTGTGSGKTEAFLYPILDYCFQNQHRSGIKVIIIYPMNALATDQAKRLAEIINEDPRLKGKIRAGLFIGEGNGKTGQFPKIMGEENIIEHRDTILDAPPDILLTNFKMLDYALMKHNFHRLWVHNFNDVSLLKFLVLDELHTYDGAQGTDVANLIRRLKLKLRLPEKQLCPIGTSATIGSGPEAPGLLADYATKVFGEEISPQAIITENRISADEFFGNDEELSDFLPLPNKLKDLVYDEEKGFYAFIQLNIDLWQQNSKELAKGLLQLKIVKDLVNVVNKGAGLNLISDITRELSMINESYRKLPQWDVEWEYSPKERVVESLLAIISEAKDMDNVRSPFMYLQIQMWIREMSGVQYTLEQPANFSFRDHLDAQENEAALPPWYCRECNSAGWLGVKLENVDAFTKDVNEVYEKYFNRNKNVYFILPKDTLSQDDFQATGYQPDDFRNEKLDPKTLKILGKNEDGFEVQALRKLDNNKTVEVCPCCNTSGTVAIVGTKIPTLSSIAISQTLATDLDAASEKDRKVLAFTNSVQDAAHQAGFVEGRNYRFALRASVQKVINELDRPILLSELADEFIDYWKKNGDETGKEPLKGYLYRFYPKDYIGKSSPKDYLLGNQYAPHFLKEFDKRIRWEIYSEFGFNSKIGRTLEKTGASSVSFDKAKLENSWENIRDWISENDVSRTINKDEFLKFTNLILHRFRNRGGINHDYLSKFRSERLSLWDLNWMRDNRHFLNPYFHQRARFPKLLTNQSSRDNLLDTTNARTSNWFHAYFLKTFIQASPTTEFINEFFEQWTSALLKSEILDKEIADGNENYAIVPEAIWVHRNIKVYRCDICEDTQYTYDDEQMIENGSCVSYRCTGHYHITENPKSNYYKKVYNRKRTPRVFAREHTGMLERTVRERLEIEFKKRENFNSANALIATSTLEMGIDIGSLNTAYNNSVPPLPSNFLQRVGRAGRSSGSALIVNFAKNQNHDLYYFTDPLEMMAGQVSTPGCYLEAKEILRRHFTAYCFDSWTTNNPQENAIPTYVRDLKLQSTTLSSEEFFINRLSKYISENNTVLVHEFLKQYDEKIGRDVFAPIREDLRSGIFYDELLKSFEKIQKELWAIDERRKELDDELKLLNLAKGDYLFEEYVREKRNLNGIKKSIVTRIVLEHLTNDGVLPNYAFPETGVKLNARVSSPKVEESTNPRLDKEFEIVRPASQAIKELAPENFFYTQGYSFEISGVNTFDWSDKNNMQTKRFCSKCDHLELSATSKPGNCPKCGDPSWSSSSNVHKFVKMTNVKSFMNSATASIKDSRDDRDSQQYQVMEHVVIDAKSSEGAWVLKDIPFGIEYVRKALITTVNYGMLGSNDARKIRINNAEALTRGFVTCKHCGKSSSAIHLLQDAKDFHYGYCKNRDVAYEPGKDEVFEEVYFFREMSTEVLKIVLPIQEFNSESDIRMFQAGLELGLKKYFHGNPNHIRIKSYREFNQNTQKFDQFLLLFDTIPGGTGYLEQLFDHNEFTLLIRLSYESIRDCTCQLDGHDGCYKCIYSYGNQYSRENLSRARAEKWFAKIYAKTESWERNANGLTSITNSGKIEESELEERFIRLLAIFCEQNEGYNFVEKKDHGTVYYELKIQKGDVDAFYWIRPQVVMGPKDGIAYTTRTDFLISCGKFQYKGNDYRDNVKKIALYMDGYQYHASAEHNVFERDINIRKSIVAQSEYTSYTMTWSDLELFNKEISGEILYRDSLAALINDKFESNYKKLIQGAKVESPYDNTVPQNNFSRLISSLLYPNSIWKKARYCFFGSLTDSLLDPSFDPSKLSELIKKEITVDSYIKVNRVMDFDALLPVQHNFTFSFCDWRIWVNIKEEKIYHHLILNETKNIDKSEWENFWTIFNIFQSSQFIEEIDDGNIDDDAKNHEWKSEVMELYDEIFHSFIMKAIDKNLINVENAEFLDTLLDEKGHVLADAELILSKVKIAIQPASDESRKILEQKRFQIFDVEQINQIEL